MELELLAAHPPQRRLAAHEARKLEADVRGPRAVAILQKAAPLVLANAKPPSPLISLLLVLVLSVGCAA